MFNDRRKVLFRTSRIKCKSRKNIQEVDNWGDVRERVRRDGNVTLKMHSDDDGSYTPGPYRMDFRKEFLEKLLLGQKKNSRIEKRSGYGVNFRGRNP